jgi:1-acyl-sn-glycerol-3-phosphate acyltransferase
MTIWLLFDRGPKSYILPHFWQWGVSKIFGLKIICEGTPYTDSQTLYISNHISYLDIPAIGSILKASFVAKEELEKWPVFGYFSKMQQTAFISRNPAHAAKEKNSLENMLKEGKSLILFPEGTSSDGTSVLPFKTSLFILALKNPTGRALPVQPVTLSIIEVDGKKPDTQKTRDIYAWHGDMTLGPHLLKFARGKGATIKIVFHPVIHSSEIGDRKVLAKMCHDDITKGMAPEELAA